MELLLLIRNYTSAINKREGIKDSTSKEFTAMTKQLDDISELYLKTVKGLDQIAIKDVLLQLSSEIEEINNRILILTEKRKWAQGKGDTALSNMDYSSQSDLYKISANCLSEIKRLESILSSYMHFNDDLRSRIKIKKCR